MRYYITILIILCFYFCIFFCAGTDNESVKLPEKENFHLFLLAGQSNMAGRGIVEEEDEVPHKRVFSLNQHDKWVPAVDPIHFDKPKIAGVGLGRTFGIILADKNPQITIGLIPCAAGGSPISVWEPGQYWEQTKSYPFDDAIRRTETAMKYGVLKGILWHQGESDSKPGPAEVYEKKLHALINRFRTDLNEPKVPFIVGQMGRHLEKSWDNSKELVNLAHETLPQKIKNTGFVLSKGFTFNEDKVHFDSKSLREFGRRYAEVYLSITE